MNMLQIREIENSVITVGPCHLPVDSNLLKKCIMRSCDSVAYVKMMFKNTNNDTLQMEFTREKKYKKYDRAYCLGSPVSLKSEIRAGLFGDLTCIDQSSAQPRAMVSALLNEQSNDLFNTREEFAGLFHYVENKHAERERVANLYFDGDTSKSKELYQKLTFGGSNDYPQDKQLKTYCNNLRHFANMVCVENPKIMQQIKKQKEKDGDKNANVNMCTLALYGRNVEQRITECAVKYMIDKGYIQNREFASMHDGIMFVCNNDVKQIIHEVNAHVKSSLGFEVQFEEEDYTEKQKNFFDKLNGDSVLDVPEQYKQKFDREYFTTLKTHEDMQAYWEMHFHYCVDQCKTGQLLTKDVFLKDRTIETERSLRWFSDKDLMSAYGNLDHCSEFNKMTGKPEKFVRVWLSLEDRRSYNHVDVIPYPSHYIPNKKSTKDTFNAFVGYPKYIWGDTEKYSEEKMKKLLTPFFTMVMHLVGCKMHDKVGCFNNETISNEDHLKFDTLMHLIGHRIMRPSDEKKAYACLIQSIQGTGKNTLFDVICRLVGASHYKCSSKVEDFCGDHAEGFLGKLFCVMNEAEISKTGKHKNAIKELISEEKSTCNIKYQRPFEYAVRAMIIVLSNESCPVNLDTCGKDRRWIVMEANDFCAKRWGESMWKKLHAHFRKPEFLRALKQYFQGLDYDAFNYKNAKKQNNKTEAYKKLASYFIPSELLFIQDYIETAKYQEMTFSEKNTKPFYETFDHDVKIKARDFFEYAQAYYKETNNDRAQTKTFKNFNSTIQKFNMPIEKTTSKDSSKCAQFSFNAKKVYSWLVSNEYVDEETLDTQVKDILNDNETQQIEVSCEDCGFDI